MINKFAYYKSWLRALIMALDLITTVANAYMLYQSV